MKKILYAYNIVENDNEYVSRMVEITELIDDVEVFSSLDEFWNPTREYDFIFISWPDYLFNWRKDLNEEDVQKLEIVFNYYKTRNTKILTILHDEYAHGKRSIYRDEIFDICYQKCDTLIHLGEYSYKKYLKDNNFIKQKQVIIYHPLFKGFDFEISKNKAREELGIKTKDFYIIVPGGIRHRYEYEYVLDIYKKIKQKNKKIFFLRATHINKPPRALSFNFFFFKLNEWIQYKLKGIKLYYKFMSPPILSKYFSACDLVILPRIDILNSGNITLSTQFNKLIIGCKIGNIAEWLIHFNHINLDFQKKDLIEPKDLTNLIAEKNKQHTELDINKICSDEVIKEQILNALRYLDKK